MIPTAHSRGWDSKESIIPGACVRASLGLEPGDRAVWVLRDGVGLLMNPERYACETAGSLSGTYGRTREEIDRYLDDERDWE